MHHAAYKFVRDIAGQLGPVGCVLEIGSRNVNGSVRGLFTADSYLGIDVVPGEGVDRVANGATFDPTYSFDLVVCCEVLEHTPEAEAIVANAFRLLKPGGHFVMTCASDDREPHSAIDGGPLRHGEHYQNIGPLTMTKWLGAACATVQRIQHADRIGDLYCWATKAAE